MLELENGYLKKSAEVAKKYQEEDSVEVNQEQKRIKPSSSIQNSDDSSDFTYSPKSDSIDSDKYRQTYLAKAKCNSMNNSVEILKTGIREGFDRELWATIIDNISAEFVFSLLSDQDILSAGHEYFYTDKSQKRTYAGHGNILDKIIDDSVESSDIIVCGLLVRG
ncbi:3421_t:CDS:2, partial [Scutellospora calospora]